MSEEIKIDESTGALRKRFIEPPFSILDTKSSSWRERKNRWLNLGIKGEEGRDAECIIGENDSDYMPSMKSGTSIFDPALCEIMYKWFCPDGGNILDPFAGGSVRGIVAKYQGYNYTGIELRPEQVDANRKQAVDILGGITLDYPKWICGDSNKILDTIENEFDFIFSCPPYADLEVYSNLEDDLSNMDYQDFLLAYRSIINKSVSKLKTGHLAVFVVGDVRDKDGYYYDFISDTKGSKKLVKIHQNVLCFKKVGEMPNTLNKKIIVDYINRCTDCKGKIVRTNSGRTCQDCFKDY